MTFEHAGADFRLRIRAGEASDEAEFSASLATAAVLRRQADSADLRARCPVGRWGGGIGRGVS